MKLLLKSVTAKAVALLATLTIGFAVLLLLVRLMLPYANDLREQVGQQLGDFLGVDVRVGDLAIRLEGLSPRLTVIDAELHDPVGGHLLLSLRELRASLDIAATLRARKPRIDGVTLVGADVEVRRTAEGKLRISGLDAMTGNDPDAMGFFLREGRLRLAQSTLYWSDRFAGVPTVAIAIDRLDFNNHGRQHQVRLDAHLAQDPDRSLRLLGSLDGAPRRPDTWSGQIYAQWHTGDVARVLIGRLPAGLRLSTKRMQIDAWARLQDGRIIECLGELAMDGLLLRRTDGAPRSFGAGPVRALARWQPRATGWRLQIADLTLAQSGQPPWHSDLLLERDRLPTAAGPGGAADAEPIPGASRVRWQGAVERLPIEPLRRLLGLVDLDLPTPATRLLAAPIDGELRALAWRLEQRDAAPHAIDWRVLGDVNGFGAAAAAPNPEVRGLSLQFDLMPEAGYARLDTYDGLIDLRPLMSAPTRFTRLEGEIGWDIMPAGSIRINAPRLIADTPDLETLTRLRLCAHPSGASPFIDLQTQIRDGDAEILDQYLPVGIMNDQLEAWLKRALVSGHLDHGELLLRGKLEDFPFDDHQGRFLFSLAISDAILDYQPPRARPAVPQGDAPALMRDAQNGRQLGWPRLEEVAADVRFEDRAFEVDVSQAKLLESEVISGHATLPDLWNPTYLHIAARGEGPLSDGMRVLRETPLSYRLGAIAGALLVEGDVGVALELGVPLKKELPFTYRGELSWREGDTASVGISGTDLRFNDVRGRLDFDGDGLSARRIDAIVDAQPVRVDVATLDAGGPRARTQIGIGGRIGIDALRRRFPNRLWQLAGGTADWRLALTLNNADVRKPDPPLDYELRSDLRGIGLSLPEPLGKRAGEAMALSLSGRFARTGPLAIDARLGNLGGRLEIDRPVGGMAHLARLALDPSALPTRLPDRPGIVVGGRLPSLDLGPWLTWWAEQGQALLASGPGGNDAALPILPSHLEIGEVRLGALGLHGVDATLAPREGDGWSVRFNARETDGGVEIPAQRAGPGADDALRVQFSRLDLATLKPAGGGDGAADLADPRRLGRIALRVDALHWGEELLGRLEIRTEPITEGVRFRELTLVGPLIRIAGEGRWSVDTTDYQQTTASLSAQSPNLGELLRTMGYYDALQRAPASAKLELAWPGGPQGLSLQRARGTFRFDVGAGQLLDIDPGVGRMLGVLNMGALQRRLSLDFSDVVGDGFGFDEAKGSIGFSNGLAHIERLDILAPTADIRITGTTDLVGEQLDQVIRVTPKIGSGVAIASAVAGGPLVGAAVYLADKVAGDAVDRIGRYQYLVTGPWEKPLMRRANGAESASDPAKAPSAGEPQTGSPSAAQPPGAAPAHDNPFLEGF